MNELQDIELPEVDSRQAQIWTDLFTPLLLTEFPAIRLHANETSSRLINALLGRLREYYGKAQSR